MTEQRDAALDDIRAAAVAAGVTLDGLRASVLHPGSIDLGRCGMLAARYMAGALLAYASRPHGGPMSPADAIRTAARAAGASLPAVRLIAPDRPDGPPLVDLGWCSTDSARILAQALTAYTHQDTGAQK
ncbi:hypothetical protein GT204_07960 [Streptomyces sp. SID4919]|uniref:hypothetical protein n=1 Tax=unclassified Streptomyces TaxID=2593676 RepID=UPI00082380E4|nr:MULTISPECIES: hypothetical protein [unclassified Streptomyces]MYY08840.1 hypothetical protein [Streptomyces sp. SID4919]SCK25721.1 hypothetical protein YW7DRAFT_01976 [Streptomyces sp. AmelKG-E11A]